MGNVADNAGSLIFNGGVLRYVGTNAAGAVDGTQSVSVRTDRLFTLAGNGTLASFGSYGNLVAARTNNHASITFANPGQVAFSGTGARILNLRGDSLGDNEINLELINNPNGGGALTINKADAGLWILGNSNNSYTGPTQIAGGALRGVDGASLPTNSNLQLSGSGVFETYGIFDRAIGTGNDQVQWGAAANASGGFAASTAKLVVNLGGAGATIQWGGGGIGNGTGALILSSSTAWAGCGFPEPDQSQCHHRDCEPHCHSQ